MAYAVTFKDTRVVIDITDTLEKNEAEVTTDHVTYFNAENLEFPEIIHDVPTDFQSVMYLYDSTTGFTLNPEFDPNASAGWVTAPEETGVV